MGSLMRAAVGRLFFRGYEETGGRIPLERLGLAHPERVHYSASPWWILHWLLPRSEVRPDDVFVEFGCGKGRVVLDAAKRYPFKRVVGVELSPELSEIARGIVAHQQAGLRCRHVVIETEDATRYAVPDDATYAYFYNPFHGATFGQVLQNIIASLDRAPRKLRLIYLNPVEHETVLATGRFRSVRQVRTTRFVSERAVIYEAV